jgi:predicted Zn-ribbon and HTH transcriptional regulator
MSDRLMSKCPQCRANLQRMTIADSDERVYATWRYCEKCGFDERTARLTQASGDVPHE